MISKIQTKVPARFSLWGLNLFRTIFLLFLASTVECTDTVKNVLGLWCPLFCRGVNWKSVFTVNPKKFLVFDKAATEMMYRTSHLFVKRAWPVCHPCVPTLLHFNGHLLLMGESNKSNEFFFQWIVKDRNFVFDIWREPIIELQMIFEWFSNNRFSFWKERGESNFKMKLSRKKNF